MLEKQGAESNEELEKMRVGAKRGRWACVGPGRSLWPSLQ